jgi:hypothetical protein
LPGSLGLIAHRLGLGAVLDPHRLYLIRWWRVGDRFGFQMPAFGAPRRRALPPVEVCFRTRDYRLGPSPALLQVRSGPPSLGTLADFIIAR